MSLIPKIFETNRFVSVVASTCVRARRQFEWRCSIGKVQGGYIVTVSCALGRRFAKSQANSNYPYRDVRTMEIMSVTIMNLRLVTNGNAYVKCVYVC